MLVGAMLVGGLGVSCYYISLSSRQDPAEAEELIYILNQLHIHIIMYIYIYIERERDREIDR